MLDLTGYLGSGRGLTSPYEKDSSCPDRNRSTGARRVLGALRASRAGSFPFRLLPIFRCGHLRLGVPKSRVFQTVPKPQPVRLPADDSVLLRIPGSNLALKPSLFRRVRGDEGVKEVPDWAPETHELMPDIVRFGRSVRNSRGELMEGEDGGIRGCGVCHSATGIGRPENAGPAGLPLAYILQQLEDFRHGLRLTANPKKENGFRMASFAKLMTPEESRAAARIFCVAALPADNQGRRDRHGSDDVCGRGHARGAGRTACRNRANR